MPVDRAYIYIASFPEYINPSSPSTTTIVHIAQEFSCIRSLGKSDETVWF